MKRKITSLVLVLLLALSAYAVPALALSIETKVQTQYASDTIYVRKRASKGSTPTVGVVKRNQAIVLLDYDDPDDGESWSKIKVKRTGAVGYLKNKYIKYFGLKCDGEIDKHEDDDSDSSGSSERKTAATLGVVYTRNGGSVNVRKSATSNSNAVGTARTGEYLKLRSISGSWYRVVTDRGLSGYIHEDYVSEGIPATITGRSVNFRKGPGSGYGSYRTLSYGTNVTLLSDAGSWDYIKYGSQRGYVFSDYVDRD